ncbi:YolD-like family protein [Pseudoneobacillus rhizosphaerae]|uniref:YolD-like family protein n=1 Tax=Pseudoneobacillus rhizosphaerae TaxID=2880968 RepID=A0A9C7LD10_9BACI|nr:YolD-like family protein [Pseudoneobacillus rhizosphaerae]CAG9610788.1 hypothetical protein NEOCIP111885_04566 [Pseudoneobacillus rhizosphaerae]
MSRIRDRGKMKWQSAFFMPEHVKMLKELRSDYQKINKPIVDESQIDEFEQKLCLALEHKQSITITIWEEGFFRMFIGSVQKLDEWNKTIHLVEEDGCLTTIWFNQVVGVDLLEEK